MAIQHKVWRRIAGKQRSDLPSKRPDLTCQSACLHFKCGALLSVNDLAQADFARQCFRQHERIER